MKFSFWNLYWETTIERLRFLFSIEFALTVGIIFLLLKVPAIENWLSAPYTPDFKAGYDTVIQQHKEHQNLKDLRFLMVYLLTLAPVCGIGEIIRRKLKFRSLFVDKSNSNNKKK